MQKLNPNDYIGKVYIGKEGSNMTVVEFKSFKEVTVEFERGHTLTVQLGNLKRGTISDPYYPSLFNLGYMGIGKHIGCINGKKTKAYEKWQGMFIRIHYKEDIRNHCYINTGIDVGWHNFQNFGDWWEENYNPETMEGWHIDKDILQKGNKIYSPETCCIVPQELNKLFLKRESKRGEYPIGVRPSRKRFQASIMKYGKREYIGHYKTPEEAFQAYKTAKEAYIKEVAEKWKHLIDPKVYQAMYEYQVEITD